VTFINVNIHLDPDLSVQQAHDVSEKIETEVGALIERSEVFIHMEPHDPGHMQA
jgi:divalent metal cation (Fe/Co/Zn/Cd) transporter